MDGRDGVRRLRDGARRWGAAVTANASLGLLSVVLAVVVWVVVSNSERPTSTKSFEVRLEAAGVPRGYVASGISPDKVSVTVRGPANVVRGLPSDDIKAKVDLSGIGDRAVGTEFTVDGIVKVETPRRVKGEAALASVRVTLEQLTTKRKPVRMRQVGVPPVGYEADIGPPDPLEVLVIGAPRNVDAVEFVGGDVKLDGLTVSVPQPVTLEARNNSGQTIGGVTVQPDRATVKVNVVAKVFQRQIVVDVGWRGQPKTGVKVASVSADPALVTVVGPLELINNLTSVKTDVVDVEGADRDVKRSVRLQLPSGVTATVQAVSVTVGLQVVRASAPLSVVPRLINLGPNLTATLSPPVVAVNLTGPLGDLTQLRPTDVAVTVDVTGLGPGSFEREPKVEAVPPNLQLESVAPGKVRVEISLIR
jgi:YbbR domain-containing protein